MISGTLGGPELDGHAFIGCSVELMTEAWIAENSVCPRLRVPDWLTADAGAGALESGHGRRHGGKDTEFLIGIGIEFRECRGDLVWGGHRFPGEDANFAPIDVSNDGGL